jgi:hypothetical protein
MESADEDLTDGRNLLSSIMGGLILEVKIIAKGGCK